MIPHYLCTCIVKCVRKCICVVRSSFSPSVRNRGKSFWSLLGNLVILQTPPAHDSLHFIKIAINRGQTSKQANFLPTPVQGLEFDTWGPNKEEGAAEGPVKRPLPVSTFSSQLYQTQQLAISKLPQIFQNTKQKKTKQKVKTKQNSILAVLVTELDCNRARKYFMEDVS